MSKVRSRAFEGLALERATADDLSVLSGFEGAEGAALEAALRAKTLWVALHRPPELVRCADCDTRDDCQLRVRCKALNAPRKVRAGLCCELLDGDGSNSDGSNSDGSNSDGSNGDGSNSDGSNGDGSNGDNSSGWLLTAMLLPAAERDQLLRPLLAVLLATAREAGIARLELDGSLLKLPERLRARNLGFSPAPRARLVVRF